MGSALRTATHRRTSPQTTPPTAASHLPQQTSTLRLCAHVSPRPRQVSSFNAPVGEVYDPRLHSKASTVEREQAAGTILEQAACGWMMGGEVLMQAECVISSRPPLPPGQEEAETMSEGATEEAAEAEEAVEAKPASE